MLRPLVLVFLTASAAWFAPAVVCAQPLVRVRGEARIFLSAQPHDEQVDVEGSVLDDVGVPLDGRPIVLALRDAVEHGTRAGTQLTHTDERGTFTATLQLPPGRWWMEATFEGDTFHEGAHALTEIALAPVSLTVAFDGAPVVDLGGPPRVVLVEAHSSVGPDGIGVVVSENGRELARGSTDAAGQFRFSLDPTQLGPPSLGRLRVRGLPDGRRAETVIEVPFVRWLATQLTLALVSGDDASRLRLEGTLTSASGPLGGRAVGLWRDEQHVATVLTDDDGVFSAGLPFAAASDGTGPLVARFDPDAPWWGASTSEPIVLPDAPTPGTPFSWVLVCIAACGLVSLVIQRAGRHRFGPVRRGPTTSVVPGVRRRRSDERLVVDGCVVDARSGELLAGAIVRVDGRQDLWTSGGTFRAELPPGAHTLEIVAPGFDSIQLDVGVPHRGEWSDVLVRLSSLRDAAWETLPLLAAKWAPEGALPSSWTARDLASVLDESSNASPAIASLVTDVEVAAYAPDPPTSAQIDEIRARARQLTGAPDRASRRTDRRPSRSPR